MNRKSKELLRLLMILIGNILDAAGFVLFVSGSGLITGGTSGIGLFLSRQTGIPTSVYVFIINAVMLVVGLIFLGKRFALSTILSTFCYPLAMAIMEQALHGHAVTMKPTRCRSSRSSTDSGTIAGSCSRPRTCTRLSEHMT